MPKGEHLKALNAQRAAELWPRVAAALAQVEDSGRDAAPAAELAAIADLLPMQVGLAVRYAGSGWKLERREGRTWVVRDFVRPMGARAVADVAPVREGSVTADEIKKEHGPGFLDWLFGP